MKKLLVALCFACALSLAAHAAEEAKEKKSEKRAAPTAEQKAFRKSLVPKYDEDKNGKLSTEEKAKISQEDWDKAGYAPRKEKKEKKAIKEKTTE